MEPSESPAPPPADARPLERRRDRAALPPGARLGELEIVRVLAVGGFGIVYVAHDHSLERDVAVKEFMPGQLAGRDPDLRVTVRSAEHADVYAAGLRSFIDEAKLLARFSHPAMVKVYRIWEANGTAYMVMPYLRGPTLSDLRRSMSQRPTEAWLRRVVDPLLDALAMLHAEGVFHRDISPENVLMAEGGPVLLDFGAARRTIVDRTQSLTAILKPRYAPIEQYAEAKGLRQGPWTDLYALGALLAYLLTGEPPPAATTRAIHDDRTPLARRPLPGVSAAFLSAVDWALAVRPADRPQSVAQFRRALNAGRSVAAPTKSRLPWGPARIPAKADGAPSEPFAKTVQLDRTDAPADPVAADGWRLRRFLARPWRTAMAGAVCAVAAAWPLARQAFAPDAGVETASPWPAVVSALPPAPPPDAGKEIELPAERIAASPAEAGQASASLPGDNAATAVAPPTETTPAASSEPLRMAEASEPAPPDEKSEPMPPAAAAQNLEPASEPRTSTRTGGGSAAAPARTKHPTHAGAAPRSVRLASASHARSIGPVEMCADHNFFLRPYCLQRRCDEPRFKQHPYCVQLRQIAQNRRNLMP